jgi:hypothetical protein
LQGSYKHVTGFVHNSPESLAVVGSVQGIDKDVFYGKGFSCANPTHKKPCATVPVNMNFFQKEDPFHINQVVPCTSRSKFFFVPNASSASNAFPNTVAKLCTFLVVMNTWVDYENHIVVFPKIMTLQRSYLDFNLKSPFKSIYDITHDDWPYYIPYKNVHMANMYNWVENSFSIVAGPFVNFHDAVDLRNVLTHCFSRPNESFGQLQFTSNVKTESDENHRCYKCEMTDFFDRI